MHPDARLWLGPGRCQLIEGEPQISVGLQESVFWILNLRLFAAGKDGGEMVPCGFIGLQCGLAVAQFALRVHRR